MVLRTWPLLLLVLPVLVKSEFMKVINKLAINLSNSSPDYAYYTFEFKNLHEIDGLKYIDLEITEV
jgi:hypothetical protein